MSSKALEWPRCALAAVPGKLGALPVLRAASRWRVDGRSGRRSSSVRQSKRLIIAVSPVQVRPPLRAAHAACRIRGCAVARDVSPGGRPPGTPDAGTGGRPPDPTRVQVGDLLDPGPILDRGTSQEKGTPSWLPPM